MDAPRSFLRKSTWHSFINLKIHIQVASFLTLVLHPFREKLNLLLFAAEDKIALLVANQRYDNLCALVSPVMDVQTVALALQRLQFKVIALMDLNFVEIKNMVDLFCKMLSDGVYGTFLLLFCLIQKFKALIDYVVMYFRTVLLCRSRFPASRTVLHTTSRCQQKFQHCRVLQC